MTALATDIQSLKIHREYTHARDRTPIFISQNRKRLFATFNYLDKKYATVFDRPPSIRLQYADCQLPLDISEDALFSDHVFQQECAKLTEDGWNIQGGGNGPSSPRARFLLCRILEDILDLRLSLPAQRDERKLKYVPVLRIQNVGNFRLTRALGIFQPGCATHGTACPNTSNTRKIAGPKPGRKAVYILRAFTLRTCTRTFPFSTF